MLKNIIKYVYNKYWRTFKTSGVSTMARDFTFEDVMDRCSAEGGEPFRPLWEIRVVIENFLSGAKDILQIAMVRIKALELKLQREANLCLGKIKDLQRRITDPQEKELAEKIVNGQYAFAA